jgi:hypothetical protein
MLRNFFGGQRCRKQRANKKYNVDIDSAASSGGQVEYVSFAWPPLEAAL